MDLYIHIPHPEARGYILDGWVGGVDSVKHIFRMIHKYTYTHTHICIYIYLNFYLSIWIYRSIFISS